MTLFENEYYKLALDTKTPCLEWIGKQFMPSAEFRESEVKSVEFYKKYKPKYPKLEYFVDSRDIGPISPKDTEWIIKEILPEMLKDGLRKEAFVVPKTAVGKIVVKNYVSNAGITVEMDIFETVDEAKKWLKS